MAEQVSVDKNGSLLTLAKDCQSYYMVERQFFGVFATSEWLHQLASAPVVNEDSSLPSRSPSLVVRYLLKLIILTGGRLILKGILIFVSLIAKGIQNISLLFFRELFVSLCNPFLTCHLLFWFFIFYFFSYSEY